MFSALWGVPWFYLISLSCVSRRMLTVPFSDTVLFDAPGTGVWGAAFPEKHSGLLNERGQAGKQIWRSRFTNDLWLLQLFKSLGREKCYFLKQDHLIVSTFFRAETPFREKLNSLENVVDAKGIPYAHVIQKLQHFSSGTSFSYGLCLS